MCDVIDVTVDRLPCCRVFVRAVFARHCVLTRLALCDVTQVSTAEPREDGAAGTAGRQRRECRRDDAEVHGARQTGAMTRLAWR